MVGDFAYLQAVSVTSFGAFLDWGLVKDLLVPFKEQNQLMLEGNWYVVYVYLDEVSHRIAATAKVERYLDKTHPEYELGQEVNLMIYRKSDLGYNVIVNGTHTGLIYFKEVFRPLKPGEQCKGYIKRITEDGKINLIIDKPGLGKVNDISKIILDKLKENKGFIPLSDKSPSEDIYDMFGISKKTFKKAIGGLYKQRLIKIEENGIKNS
jgi:predicted RNA-binding protein (virulence factor B family)